MHKCKKSKCTSAKSLIHLTKLRKIDEHESKKERRKRKRKMRKKSQILTKQGNKETIKKKERKKKPTKIFFSPANNSWKVYRSGVFFQIC